MSLLVRGPLAINVLIIVLRVASSLTFMGLDVENWMEIMGLRR